MKKRPPIKPQIIVDFHRRGYITKRQLGTGEGKVEDEACPETHFWCSDRDVCLPVFVRCNGVFDCPGHEDERDCDMYICPGFFRCRTSKVCLHVTHVCDGWPQCPQRDDELLCARSCPLNCTCHGLAFFCKQVFSAHQYPDLRYLDMRSSGMNVLQLGYNYMLIHLSLASCRVKTLSNFTFYNLHSLDLSGNLLKEVCNHHFGSIPQLTALFLSDNPLTSVFGDPTHIKAALPKLMFPDLKILNLSHSGVELLQWNSTLEPVSSIQQVDLRGCVVDEFSQDVIRGFLHLQLLYVDNFKLCCSAVLTPGFDLNHCHTTPDEVVSCDDLLGSITHRTMVGVLATLALLGNVVSLMVRMCVKATWRLSSGNLVLSHLSVADLGMGLYLVTIALADRLLAGDYVWQDSSWRKGAVCHLAGVLSMSCRHATTFFTTILSLDYCLCHHWSLTGLSPSKARIICAMVWAFSLLLSVYPLMSQWQFFGRHGLCFPLAHKMIGSLEFRYSYAVLVVAHFVLYVACCVCEVISKMGSTLLKTRIANTTSCLSDSRCVVLGSLASGFLYTIACLVPTDTNTDKQKAILMALVYFGSMVSCATNPYLHL